MKTLKFTLLFCLTVSGLYSQTPVENDTMPVFTHTVYQMDGSVLKGAITEWHDDYITLRLMSGVEIKISTGHIRKIVAQTQSPAKKYRGIRERSYGFKEEGIYHVTTTAFSAGPAAGIGLTHAVGYRFSRLLGVGAGIGAESFEIGEGNQIVPLFVEARGFFMKQNISPYYALRAGYGFALKSSETNITEAQGGRMFGAELGYRFGGVRAVNFFAGVGVHFQKATYVYEWPWEGTFRDELDYRRTELKIGVIF